MTGPLPAFEPPIELQTELDRRINYAMQQNDVPVIKALAIENRAGEVLRDLELRISVEPDFAVGWSRRLDLLTPGQRFSAHDVDLQLSPSVLAELTERVRGQIWFEVLRGGHALIRKAEPIELLACDEWGGLSSLPEILAAFVTPNHPVVAQVLGRASDLLGRSTGDPSLSGYQSRSPARVLTTAAAIFTAIRDLDIRYAVPPASFESQGQRVRLPGRIASEKLATCLDLALLACSCLEQAGLHPLLNIVTEHAFAGVWLDEQCFPDAIVEDGLRIRKRVELGEIGLFDPTCATARPFQDFERATAEATRRLAELSNFHCTIDIERARKGRVRPIAERVERAPDERPTDQTDRAHLEFVPPLADVSHEVATLAPAESVETPRTRLDKWRQKLLDLSLRNRLLNFKDTKRSIPLLCPDLARFEDMLADGASFQILPRPRDLGAGDPRNGEAHWRRTGKEALGEIAREELDAKRIHSDLDQEELENRLLATYRTARVLREEGGASSLYLAIGFLAWTETSTSEQRRYAPLLLLPLELHRKSAREGFSLSLGDEDARFNATLLEMLHREHGVEIPGLDPLPEDGSGLDVSGILRVVRQAVRDIDRWEVLDVARIGLFSFSKFLMWRDLSQRLEDLLRNKVVDHLVNRPGHAFDDAVTLPSPERLDDERPIARTFCPLPADSSQLAAVFAAADGKSFVLEGPPGTGKSQTIANLIAHCLAEGKSVLFVSEKMAALEVVHRRLQKIGLGRHCLELHSNKAHKREVIGQLAAAMDRMEPTSPEGWEREARRLEELRQDLNRYVRTLHERHPAGHSVFQATSRLIALRNVERVDLRWESPDAIDVDTLVRLREITDQLAAAAGACETLRGNAWEHVGRSDWSVGWQDEVKRAVAELAHAVAALETCWTDAARSLRIEEPDPSIEALATLREVGDLLLASPGPPVPLLVRSDWQEMNERIGAWIEHGRRRDELRTGLFARFSEGILKLDVGDLSERLRASRRSFGPLRWWRRRPVRKALRSVAKDRKAPAAAEIEQLLRQTRRLQEEDSALARAGDEAREILGRFWNGGEAEWGALQSVRDWARRFRTLAQRVAGEDLERAARLREHWARLATEGRELLATEGSVGRVLIAFRAAHESLLAVRGRVAELLALDAQACWGEASAPGVLARMRDRARRWSEATTNLRDWCAWRRQRAFAHGERLGPLIEACESNRVAPSELLRVFDRSYYEWWLAAVVDREPVLNQFVSYEHERRIQRFREADDRFADLTQDLVQARLAERATRWIAEAKPNAEIAVIKKEAAKKARHLPVRALFQRTPGLLPHLKPCLLMSPMSVAQYLDPAHPPFDLVVFDEASQIPVWDAVGALARGHQAVIVGDPKQLPPTNFFMKADDEQDESEESGDFETLESVLDDCIAANLPWLRLDCHYRSRHETLIAFSNFNYYDNRLVTFPSPHRTGLGVSWSHVASGVYDRGKSRTNRAEAEAVVAEIVRRLREPDLSRYTIGVVTFNLAQQNLIENLLDKARQEDPALEPFFDEGQPERIFVKNLENVQGDERDVILFSICYGPDPQGRVAMNFGPVNREGGERRLNVAVTRARREVIVFSTVRPEHIDLARTRARGVRDLKQFLEYAARGVSVLGASANFDADADFDSPFEKAVHDALVARGWTAHLQVGCSGYRIDLAIVDPEMPGRYLLGVECDGANYHRARTARDRDKLREAVLRELGWKLHRIWSTDWWQDPDREIEKLEGVLRALVATPDEARAGVAAATAHPAEEVDSDEGDEQGDEDLSGSGLIARSAMIQDHGPASAPRPHWQHAPVARYLAFEGRAGPDPRTAQLDEVVEGLHRIVATEGPICARRAYAVYLRGCGIKRMGSELKTTMNRALAAAIRRGLVQQEDERGKGGLIWSTLRMSGAPPVKVRERGPRTFEEIPPSELQAVARDLAENGLEYGSEAHRRALLARFDLVRLTPQVDAALTALLAARDPYEGT